jgi:CubicO group peptidase (beta-lactamase class C family)
MIPAHRARRCLALALGIALAGSSAARERAGIDLAAPWPRAAAREVGMDGPALAAAMTRAAALPRARSLLVARRGRLVLESYFAGADASTLFDVRSVTKSVVGSLAGIALAEGRIALDDSIAGYLMPRYSLDGEDTSVRIRDLLDMTAGYVWNENDGPDYNIWIASADRVQFLLDRPRASPAGAQFTYNSAAAHLLGVVLELATGVRLPQYADERLFRALGASLVSWEPLDAGTVNGGSGIRLRAQDLLKFGQLFLQRGYSADRSVLPEAWVDEVTRPRFDWRRRYGAQRSVSYGMLWWVADAEPAAFFAWGYGGQFVYVVPSFELVVVTTTEWRQISETTPLALAEQLLGVIVEGVLPAVR